MGVMVGRIAMLSAHTSPLEQPGTGDAGGMNVYVLETARRMARRGIPVDIFTKADGSDADVVDVEAGVRVHVIEPGGIGLALMSDRQRFDLVHSHYWLSGQIGLVVREHRDLPLVHSMHTMGRVKNLSLAAGDHAESAGRITAESEIVRLADRLVANTHLERDELVSLYGADSSRVDVVHPGVDLGIFCAGRRAESREALGIDTADDVLLFAGRLQPHKGPEVVIGALAHLSARARLVIIGGPSGAGLEHPEGLAELADQLGVRNRITVLPPVSQFDIARWYAAADVVVVPSYSESFGLVALEAQACGTPVVAAAVGGLTTAVIDGVTGFLIDGHDPRDYAGAIRRLFADAALHRSMSVKAAAHASDFTWDATVDRLLSTYERVMAS